MDNFRSSQFNPHTLVTDRYKLASTYYKPWLEGKGGGGGLHNEELGFRKVLLQKSALLELITTLKTEASNIPINLILFAHYQHWAELPEYTVTRGGEKQGNTSFLYYLSPKESPKDKAKETMAGLKRGKSTFLCPVHHTRLSTTTHPHRFAHKNYGKSL